MKSHIYIIARKLQPSQQRTAIGNVFFTRKEDAIRSLETVKKTTKTPQYIEIVKLLVPNTKKAEKVK